MRTVSVPHMFPFPFCICSISVPYPFRMHSVSVPYPFRIRSVSVPYPFPICSVSVPYPFRIHSLSVLCCSVNVLLVFDWQAFWELVQKNKVSKNSVVHSTDKEPKRAFCDTFSDVINVIVADSSAKLGNNTIVKVNQDIDVLFCFSSRGNLSIQV